jgi:hypothetical protein
MDLWDEFKEKKRKFQWSQNEKNGKLQFKLKIIPPMKYAQEI